MPTPPPALFELRSWEELDRDLLQAFFAARQAVFVVEQNCPYQDIDGLDPRCLHLFARSPEGGIGAYARLLPPGVRTAKGPAIGRVLTTRTVRGRGWGRALMRRAVQLCVERWNSQPIHLAAQHYLQAFYEELGFVPTGDVFLEDGIPHLEMERPPDAPPLS